jgi:hypothetical protein
VPRVPGTGAATLHAAWPRPNTRTRAPGAPSGREERAGTGGCSGPAVGSPGPATAAGAARDPRLGCTAPRWRGLTPESALRIARTHPGGGTSPVAGAAPMCVGRGCPRVARCISMGPESARSSGSRRTCVRSRRRASTVSAGAGRQHQGYTAAFHAAERAALHAIEQADLGLAWEDLRRSLRAKMEGSGAVGQTWHRRCRPC